MHWDSADASWTIGAGTRSDISTWCIIVDNIYGKHRTENDD